MLVSILIPCYNAERWIAQAIDSALAQTWAQKEVLVVDDGSTDRSLELIRRFGDRIRWEAESNRGGNRARNRLLELAQGTWLQYLDADDYLLPTKIEAQMAAVAARPEVDVFFGPVTLEHTRRSDAHRELLPIPEPRDPWVLLARWLLPQTGASLWRRQAILDVGGWKPDQPCCQEHELYLRLLQAGKKFGYTPEGGAVYRQWGNHTVCRRDPGETNRQRLKIELEAEGFLRQRGELTPSRIDAINQTRFAIARTAWPFDKRLAREIIALVRRTQPGFAPRGVAAPVHYRAVYTLCGFGFAETLAGLARYVRRRRKTEAFS